MTNPNKEDLLLVQDFSEKLKKYYPAAGSTDTPKHNLPDFKLTSYSPQGFKYFRKVFGINDQQFITNIIRLVQ